PNMKVFDIALAENVCQHDADSTPLGVELGYVFGINKVYIKTDDKLNNMIENAAKKVCNSKIFRGTIASGDQFIAGDEQRIRIKNNFNAIAAEMEGAAVGHVCDLNKKRFTVLRAISDSADSDGAMSFETFAVKAAEISINILLEFIKSI
ncbi:MAG: 5'-methylthioadenosine/S-adenosylhomocysteine nucleosidase, partial [Clostridia bacterium]|nr:5'-methylthioadenosine/S-adenosylhomocysteine nucleosidase [Clostridia bacterium]